MFASAQTHSPQQSTLKSAMQKTRVVMHLDNVNTANC